MLPERIPNDIAEKYRKSGVFTTSPATYLQAWYEMHKALQNIDIKSVLQIGIGLSNECEMWNKLLESIFGCKRFVNIDFDKALVDRAIELNRPLLSDAMLCDARVVDKRFGKDSFDLVFWSHGPEHIKREEWPDALDGIERVASKVVILQVPWGKGYDYDPNHLSKSIQDYEFKKFGYEVITMGNYNTKHAGISAYKVM